MDPNASIATLSKGQFLCCVNTGSVMEVLPLEEFPPQISINQESKIQRVKLTMSSLEIKILLLIRYADLLRRVILLSFSSFKQYAVMCISTDTTPDSGTVADVPITLTEEQ